MFAKRFGVLTCLSIACLLANWSGASAEEYRFNIVNRSGRAANLAICNWENQDRGDIGYVCMYRGFRHRGWYVLQPGETRSFTFYVDRIDIHINFGDLRTPVAPERFFNRATHYVHPRRGFDVYEWLRIEDRFKHQDVREFEGDREGIVAAEFYAIASNTNFTIR